MSAKFVRRKEDFTCEKCGRPVHGSGYTNHCPYCLWSKHVDIHPGDRANTCLGLMEPVRIEQKKGAKVIVHRCVACNKEKRNEVAKGDDFDAILAVATKHAQGGLT